MIKIIILILISVSSFAQLSNETRHFYGSCIVYESIYTFQKFTFKKQNPYTRLLLSGFFTGIIGTGKEVFDNNRCNRNKRTGFSKEDLMIDGWAILCYTTLRFSIIDTKEKNKIDTLKYKFK